MDWKKSIKDRFVEAIKKTFPDPTPLIGEKWFVFPPKRSPADFQFVGVAKLSKATGLPPERVARWIVKHIPPGEPDLEIEITEDKKIVANVRKKPPAAAEQ
jgi:arginyl-tRNA synthetase